jgi:hypothetical protein
MNHIRHALPGHCHPPFNKHAHNIRYQIESGFSGIISPGTPNHNPLADRITRFQLEEKISNIQHSTFNIQGSSKEIDMTLHCHFFHPETNARLIHELV